MDIKQLDFFRKLPSDMDSKSVSGGIFSLIAIILGVYLFVQEAIHFNQQEVQRSLIIDNDMSLHTFRINLNMVILNVPCTGINLQILDDTGDHVRQQNPSSLDFIRFDKEGKSIGKQDMNSRGDNIHPFINGLQAKEQCNIVGHLMAEKIPGFIRIVLHNHDNLIYQFTHDQINSMRLDFKINHLSFGLPQNQERVQQHFKSIDIEKQFSQYDGQQYISKQDEVVSFNYFVKLVPNVYQDALNYLSTYQFSMNGRQMHVGNLLAHSNHISTHYVPPNINFQYQISPITVIYSIKEKSLSHFFVQICAIIGGVFSSLGILNSLTQTSANQLKKK